MTIAKKSLAATSVSSPRLPEMYFADQPVVIRGVRGGRHVIRLKNVPEEYQLSKVKVEVEGDTSLGHISPSSLELGAEGKFLFDAANEKDGELSLKFTFEKNPDFPVSFQVIIGQGLPRIDQIHPDREKFLEGEQGHFNVTVVDDKNTDIPLNKVTVGATVLGLEINHSYTDVHGQGTIPVLLKAGSYVLKAWVRWEGGERQRYEDLPFTVHPK